MIARSRSCPWGCATPAGKAPATRHHATNVLRAGGSDCSPRCRPIRLTLLVGTYAQDHALGPGRMTEAGRGFRRHLPNSIPLPHPSWRSRHWAAQNPVVRGGGAAEYCAPPYGRHSPRCPATFRPSTIGHSTRSIAGFVELLEGAGSVDMVVDIRKTPRSRTNPHFTLDTLPEALSPCPNWLRPYRGTRWQAGEIPDDRARGQRVLDQPELPQLC